MYKDWPEDFPQVTSLVPYSALRHNPDPEIQDLYDQAKYHQNIQAAVQLIKRLVINEGKEKVIEKIETISSAYPNAILVPVHAIEGRGKNKIPNALAGFISEIGNLEVDMSIVQTDVVSKTGAKGSWYRLAHRPHFEGEVQSGRQYIMVDDVFSAGGTFSELRAFIENNDGSVVDTITMSNGSKSMNPQLSITPFRILELENKYGVESLQKFFKEEALYEGNYKALTDSEARTLLGAASLNEARNRIAEARQERIGRVREEMVQGEPPAVHEEETLNKSHNTTGNTKQQLKAAKKPGTKGRSR